MHEVICVSPPTGVFSVAPTPFLLHSLFSSPDKEIETQSVIDCPEPFSQYMDISICSES